MPATIHSFTRASDIDRMKAAAQVLRTRDEADPIDLADLLDAVADAMRSVGHPALSETEMWRWSRVVGYARGIARKWSA